MATSALRKLQQKKHRDETGRSFVEGLKGIREVLGSTWHIETLYLTHEGSAALREDISTYTARTGITPHLTHVDETFLTRNGTLVTNAVGIGLIHIPKAAPLEQVIEAAREAPILILDTIRDPGNLGTIIRTADWFGISELILSHTTTDAYNPKVLNAAMGSSTRIHITYADLEVVLTTLRTYNLPIIGTTLTGSDIRTVPPISNGAIIMGSESHGMGGALVPHITTAVTIPGRGGAESLNVGVATGIVLATVLG